MLQIKNISKYGEKGQKESALKEQKHSIYNAFPFRALIDDSYSKSLLVEDITDRELDRIGRVEACQVSVCL